MRAIQLVEIDRRETAVRAADHVERRSCAVRVVEQRVVEIKENGLDHQPQMPTLRCRAAAVMLKCDAFQTTRPSFSRIACGVS